MPVLIPVHSCADSGIAGDFARFLEAGSRIRVLVAEGAIPEEGRLVDAVERALSADLVLVFLSPSAVACRASGSEWEAVLQEQARELGVAVASAMVDACTPPALLKRSLFEVGNDALGAFRRIKQWAMSHSYATERAQPSTFSGPWNRRLEELREEVADKPGRIHLSPAEAHLLDSFLEGCGRDFERVVRVDCAGRYRENLIGELCAGAGLATPGPFEADEQSAASLFAEARLLLVFENLSEPDWLPPLGELCSVLTTEPVVTWQPPAQQVLDDLRNWPNAERGGLNLIPAAFSLFESSRLEDWPVAREAGRLAFLILKRAERYAEAAAWAGRLERTAIHHGDREAAFESAGERAWIVEGWGDAAERDAAPAVEPEQLSLF